MDSFLNNYWIKQFFYVQELCAEFCHRRLAAEQIAKYYSNVKIIHSLTEKGCPRPFIVLEKGSPCPLLFLEKGCPCPFIIFGKRMSPSFIFTEKEQEDIERRGLRSSGMLISLFFSGFYFLIHLSGVIKYA